jgi:cephalosporin-C deacetylase
MPLIDMPLEELKNYQGCNPCPDDFDAYWDRAVSELDTMPVAYELIPENNFSAPGVEFFHLWFTGIGGDRIHCRFSRPKRKTPGPAVAFFHGYTGNCGDWSSHLAYALSGICYAAMDVRGQGGISEDTVNGKGPTVYGHLLRGIDDENPDRLFFRSIYLDTALLIRILSSMPEIDPERIGATGFSQGGALTLACASLSPSLKLAAAGYPFLCDFKRVWDMDLNDRAYKELKSYFRSTDPLHTKETQFWLRLGYIDLQFLAQRIRCPITFFTSLMDRICPASTQFAAYNRINAPKEMILYPDFDHEELPGAKDAIYTMMLTL